VVSCGFLCEMLQYFRLRIPVECSIVAPAATSNSAGGFFYSPFLHDSLGARGGQGEGQGESQGEGHQGEGQCEGQSEGEGQSKGEATPVGRTV